MEVGRGIGGGVKMVCVFWGWGSGIRSEGRSPLFLGHRWCCQKINRKRTNFSQGHTVREGLGGPRSPGFAAEIHSSGTWGVLESSPGIQREQGGSRRSGWVITVPWEGGFSQLLRAQVKRHQAERKWDPLPIFYVLSIFLRTSRKGDHVRPSNVCVCGGGGGASF